MVGERRFSALFHRVGARDRKEAAAHRDAILAEEEVFLKKYGESYRQYMQRVPRYFVLF